MTALTSRPTPTKSRIVITDNDGDKAVFTIRSDTAFAFVMHAGTGDDTVVFTEGDFRAVLEEYLRLRGEKKR